MLGLDYGSDSEGEDNKSTGRSGSPSPTTATQLNSLISPRPTPTPGTSTTKITTGKSSSSSFKLPPPSNTDGSASSSNSLSKGLELPAPNSKKRGAKKILLELPKLSAQDGEGSDDERPAVKKQKIDDGSSTNGKARSSALLSMLPAPKKKGSEAIAAAKEPAQRVLGGGRAGVVYSATTALEKAEIGTSLFDATEEGVEEKAEETKSTLLLPPSLALKRDKGKAPVKRPATSTTTATTVTTAPAVDFFQLGESSTPTIFPAPAAKKPEEISQPPAFSISAAPKVEEFRPPSPKIDDTYPGYYQLPSGQWAMHDAAYYKRYSDKWQKEYEAQIRALEKGMDKGFEGADGDDTVEVKAAEQLDAARKEREAKMAITAKAAREGQLKMPNMKINPEKQSGLAKTRHQLSTLLTEAYMNREALEEKIAMAKRNRKEAGNKYGF